MAMNVANNFRLKAMDYNVEEMLEQPNKCISYIAL